jgi:hypothetical protein
LVNAVCKTISTGELYARFYPSASILSNVSLNDQIALNATCGCLNSSYVANFTDVLWYSALLQATVVPSGINSSEKFLLHMNISSVQLLAKDILSFRNETVLELSIFCKSPNMTKSSNISKSTNTSSSFFDNTTVNPNYTTSGDLVHPAVSQEYILESVSITAHLPYPRDPRQLRFSSLRSQLSK